MIRHIFDAFAECEKANLAYLARFSPDEPYMNFGKPFPLPSVAYPKIHGYMF